MAETNPLWTGKRVAAAHAELGYHYIEQHAHAAAARYLERAVAVDPETARYWRSLGTAYFMLGRMAQAESRTTRAIELNPSDATAHNNLGRIYMLQGRISEAQLALQRCLELDPGYALAHFNLGKLYQARGQTDRAIDAYRRAAEAGPTVPTYWYQLALSLDEMPGREQESMDVWKRLITLVEGDPSRHEIYKDALEHMEALGRTGFAPVAGTE